MPASNGTSPLERVRGRLRTLGPASLSASELFALVIGSNGRRLPAFLVAERLVETYGGRIRSLLSAGPSELERVPGVGAASAAAITAALELGLRAQQESRPHRPRMTGPDDVYRLMAPRLRDLPHEQFHSLLLNAQHRVLREVMITRGILDASLVHPREVFRPAILERASSIILVHNHPSGDPSPSAEDREVTRQIREAGRTIGIPVLDHVIVADEGWQSVS